MSGIQYIQEDLLSHSEYISNVYLFLVIIIYNFQDTMLMVYLKVYGSKGKGLKEGDKVYGDVNEKAL